MCTFALNYNMNFMTKKITFSLFGLICLYVVALVACSCTVNRAVTTSGRATIVTIDTTTIIHGGQLNFNSKY